jgi:hypothetical protein
VTGLPNRIPGCCGNEGCKGCAWEDEPEAASPGASGTPMDLIGRCGCEPGRDADGWQETRSSACEQAEHDFFVVVLSDALPELSARHGDPTDQGKDGPTA